MFAFTFGVLAATGLIAYLEYTDNTYYATFKSWIKKIPDPQK